MALRGEAWSEARPYDVLAVGELNLDLILSGVPKAPEFGEEVLAEAVVERLGGSTANFAVFCAQLGLRVAFVSKVGRDDFGDFLIEQLEQWGLGSQHVTRDSDLRTGLTVSVSGVEDRAFVTYVGTIDSLHTDDVADGLIRSCRHLHVGSYFLQTKLQPGCAEMFGRAHEAGATVSLDTGYDPQESWDGGLRRLLREVDVFLPNEIEGPQIAQTEDMEETMRVLAGWSQVVAMKLGEEGAMACDREESVRVPACEVEVADTTCCGDGFNAGFIDGLLAEMPLADCVRRGNACGGLMASVVGNEASALSPEAVETLSKQCGDAVHLRVHPSRDPEQ
jgi:sugar/nucleoside kinase (ribokinase family)